jgi:hypothetical protein
MCPKEHQQKTTTEPARKEKRKGFMLRMVFCEQNSTEYAQAAQASMFQAAVSRFGTGVALR